MRSLPRLGAVALAALALAPALAGCLGAVTIASDDEASMASLLPAARREAEAWRAGAVLAGAFTVEGSNASEFDVDPPLPPDPIVGNGRAAAWLYRFADPTTDARLEVMVAANRSALNVEEHRDDWATGGELTWLVGSEAAMAAARGDARFAENVTGLTDPTYVLGLEAIHEVVANGTGRASSPLRGALAAAGARADPGERGVRGVRGPHWGIIVLAEDGGAMALVNATSGEVADAGNFDWPPLVFGPVETHFEAREGDRLTALDAERRHPFPVEVNSTRAHVRVCYGERAPSGSVHLTLVAPDGREHDRPPRNGSGPITSGFEDVSVTGSDIEAGQWEAVVALDGDAAVAEYTLMVWVGRGGPPWMFNFWEPCPEGDSVGGQHP